MKSITVLTYELDDIDAAAADLIKQIKGGIEFGTDTVAFLHAQPDMDIYGLTMKLRTELGLPIIGGTTAGGALLSNKGHHELAVILHIMTADDCNFAYSISDSLSYEPEQRIINVYNEALLKLKKKGASDKPKIAFCITSLVEGCSPDEQLSILNDISNALPVFGYVAADDFDFVNQKVFLNDVCGNDVMALLLIEGNVNPLFEVKTLVGTQNLSRSKVTKANKNIIIEIDDKPAYEYIKSFPFINANVSVLWNYQFFVEIQSEEGNDNTLISRALNSYDAETGEIFSFANIPQNSFISLQYCEGSDVIKSCESALLEVLKKINEATENGSSYSTVFIASCSLRNMFLADKKDAEGNLISKLIPLELTTSGVYAYSEIAPTVITDGKAVNRLHNATFTVCVL